MISIPPIENAAGVVANRRPRKRPVAPGSRATSEKGWVKREVEIVMGGIIRRAVRPTGNHGSGITPILSGR